MSVYWQIKAQLLKEKIYFDFENLLKSLCWFWLLGKYWFKWCIWSKISFILNCQLKGRTWKPLLRKFKLKCHFFATILGEWGFDRVFHADYFDKSHFCQKSTFVSEKSGIIYRLYLARLPLKFCRSSSSIIRNARKLKKRFVLYYLTVQLSPFWEVYLRLFVPFLLNRKSTHKRHLVGE